MSSAMKSTLRFWTFSGLAFVIFGYLEVFHLRLYESRETPSLSFASYLLAGPIVLALPSLSYFVASTHFQSHFRSHPRSLFSDALRSLVYVAALAVFMAYQEKILEMGRSMTTLVLCFLFAGLPGGLGMATLRTVKPRK